MARVQNTLIGKSSGSVGGATFSTWKGINVLKSKAISVANPQTVPQQTQRNRLTLMVSIYRLIALAISVGFKNLAIGQSEYNAFISENIQDATQVGVAPAVSLEPSSLLTAKGTIGLMSAVTVSGNDGEGNATINWDGTETPVGSNANDVAYGVVYNATQDVWGVESGALRSADAQTVEMPANLATGDVLHAYLFFKAFDSDEVSDSQYNTTITVA